MPELEKLRWHWEALRRNQHYRNDYFLLMTDPFPDPESGPYRDFCNKHHVAYPIHPDTNFDGLPQAKAPWIINVFSDGFRWTNDRACYLDLGRSEDAGLWCWVCPEFSKNAIEDEFTKILKTWYPKKTAQCKGQAKQIVKVCKVAGSYMGFIVSLSATRQQIKKQFASLLAQTLPAWAGDKVISKRLRNDWELSFRIYDRRHNPENPESCEDIARRLKVKPDTVYRHYSKARRAIYGDDGYRVAIVKESLPVTCDICDRRMTCKTPCKPVRHFIEQDTRRRRGQRERDFYPDYLPKGISRNNFTTGVLTLDERELIVFRAAIAGRNFKKKDLARRLGVSPSYFAQYLAGDRVMPPPLRERLVLLLGLDTVFVLFDAQAASLREAAP